MYYGCTTRWVDIIYLSTYLPIYLSISHKQEIENLNRECLELEELCQALKGEVREAWDNYKVAQERAAFREAELQDGEHNHVTGEDSRAEHSYDIYIHTYIHISYIHTLLLLIFFTENEIATFTFQ